MRRAMLLGAAFLAGSFYASAAADEKPKSGIAVGKGCPAFDVIDVTGPYKESKSVCYV